MSLRTWPIRAVVLLVALGLTVPAGVRADDSPPDYRRAFNVEVKSEPIYGIQAPTEDPARQQHIIRAADGTALFVEAWLPKAKNGNVPPDRMPSIVVMNPYSTTLQPTGSPTTLEAMVPRGYAFVHMHVRGTGRSGGCNQEFGPLEASDGGREPGPPFGDANAHTTEIVSDGSGIAIDPVCGQPPIRFDEFFGEEIK